ncbi:hypothetical protein [Massilia rhizosphaerae]|uniref:hypothetical protein n=1 Tax=Massilia rhizosphaerae TaxID=2784389 RepID=UPI0018DEBDBC|nr:hypothetical protein [Massilia rhizosphaerae]
MNLETTEKTLKELAEIEVPDLSVFPTEFVSKLNGGITRTLGTNAKPFSIKSGNPHEITFIEPAYVDNVEIEFSKPIAGAEIELVVYEAIHNRNVRKKLNHQTLSAIAAFPVSCVTSGISIYLQPSFFELFSKRTLEINRIKICGFNIDDFEVLTHSLEKIVGLKKSAADELSRERNQLLRLQQELIDRETAVDELESRKNAELETLQDQLNECQQAILESNETLRKLKDDIGRSESKKQGLIDQISGGETTVRNIEGEITKGKQRLTELAVETSEKETRLRELSSNVNLFSEEFSSFSDHGAKQSKVFIGLSIVPLAIIIILTTQLLMGAVDLSVKYVKQPNLDLLTVFVTRLPYLTICGSILAVCYSAFRFLFNRISSIYAERLDFAKIGILAKDVTFASANDLLYSDHELYEARTYLKIEMLKSYLSGNIGAFVYAKRKNKAQTGKKSEYQSAEANVLGETGGKEEEAMQEDV